MWFNSLTNSKFKCGEGLRDSSSKLVGLVIFFTPFPNILFFFFFVIAALPL